MSLPAAPRLLHNESYRVGIHRIERNLAKAQNIEVVRKDRLPFAADARIDAKRLGQRRRHQRV